MLRRALFALPALLAAPLTADTITLKNGRVIEADRAWYQGSQLLYEKNGGTFGLPRSLVQKLEQKAPAEPASDPDVLRARERLAAGDPVSATRLLRAATTRDPQSVAAWQGLAQALLALGDPKAARDAAERGVKLDPRNPRSLAVLGDALVAAGDRAGAEASYRKSLALRPDSEVEGKLGDVLPAPVSASHGPQFRIKYDGGVNEPLGMAVLKVLGDAYAEFARRLGSSPDDPVTVVLQTAAAFAEGRPPEWAEGVNDGTIRIPVQGLDAPTPRLVQVLRHELAHSFVAARTGGNCPTWLHEGIAQWVEGEQPGREDARLAPLARQGKLLPLVSLEGPFASWSGPDAELAYAESLSVVVYLVRQSGEPGITRLLAALGDRLPSEEALPVALSLSYPELQAAWSEHLQVADSPPR